MLCPTCYGKPRPRPCPECHGYGVLHCCEGDAEQPAPDGRTPEDEDAAGPADDRR